MARILIVEDDENLSMITRINLEQAGHSCRCAYSCAETLKLMKEEMPEMLLLDVMLPDGVGTELCTRVRDTYEGPIIFMSCLDDNKTICDALIGGGDDYVVKPIDYDQLKARIEANLRRVGKTDSTAKPVDIIKLENYVIDTRRHKVVAGSDGEGDEIDLSPTEYSILIYMVEHCDSILLYSELYTAIWKADSYDDFRTVMVHVSNLRKKLEVTGDSHIETVRGAGYIFNMKKGAQS